MGNRWDGIPADIFVDILHRLPPCPRRRLRLVCRHWRAVIDDRTPHPQARTKVLAFASGTVGCSHAYVVDDLTEGRASVRDLKLQGCLEAWGSTLVGTCNGLVCLRREYGDVIVINPVTGEKLVIPPPPSKTSKCLTRAASYSFGYHPATGLYKVVQVPCDPFGGWAFDAVGVFTLGDTSWREVPVAGGSSCLLRFGLISVDGDTYWVSQDACSVMSFDFNEERVAFVTTLPVRVQLGTDMSSWYRTAPDERGRLGTDDISCHLTADARGRLGLTVSSFDLKRSKKIEVWMLEEGGRSKQEGTWVLRYKIEDPRHGTLQEEIALPHATHGKH
ncbi:unnamed protein product [Urochloa humidicola]